MGVRAVATFAVFLYACGGRDGLVPPQGEAVAADGFGAAGGTMATTDETGGAPPARAVGAGGSSPILVGMGGSRLEQPQSGRSAGGRDAGGAYDGRPIYSAPPPTALPIWPDGGPPDASSTEPVVGTWVGSGPLGAPWDWVQLNIEFASKSEGVFGTMTVGRGDPPPAPSDADDPPPAGCVHFAQAPQGALVAEPLSGFTYTMLNGVVASDRELHFDVALEEPGNSWCALQESIPNEKSGWYECVPNWWPSDFSNREVRPAHLTEPTTNQIVTMNWEKYAFCNWFCVCIESGCSARQDSLVRCTVKYAATDDAGGVWVQSGFCVDPDLSTVHVLRIAGSR